MIRAMNQLSLGYLNPSIRDEYIPSRLLGLEIDSKLISVVGYVGGENFKEEA